MRKFLAPLVFAALFAAAVGTASADPKITMNAYKCLACDKVFQSFQGDELDKKDFREEKEQLKRVFQFKDRGKNLPPCKKFKYHIFDKKGTTTSGIS